MMQDDHVFFPKARIVGEFTPNPDYLGNNITFVVLTIDQQIENLKIFHARQLANLERDYELNKAGLQLKYLEEMQTLLEKKAEQDDMLNAPRQIEADTLH